MRSAQAKTVLRFIRGRCNIRWTLRPAGGISLRTGCALLRSPRWRSFGRPLLRRRNLKLHPKSLSSLGRPENPFTTEGTEEHRGSPVVTVLASLGALRSVVLFVYIPHDPCPRSTTALWTAPSAGPTT